MVSYCYAVSGDANFSPLCCKKVCWPLCCIGWQIVMWSKRRPELSTKEWGECKMEVWPKHSFSPLRFYSYNCKSPYEHLSEANLMIEKLEVEVSSIGHETVFSFFLSLFSALIFICPGEGASIPGCTLWSDRSRIRPHRTMSSWEQDAETDVGLHFFSSVRGITKVETHSKTLTF